MELTETDESREGAFRLIVIRRIRRQRHCGLNGTPVSRAEAVTAEVSWLG